MHTHHVYRNWTRNRGRIHLAECSHCNHGKGTQPYRAKALIAEHRAKETSDPTAKQDWEELAIEWHMMASIAAKDRAQNAPE